MKPNKTRAERIAEAKRHAELIDQMVHSGVPPMERLGRLFERMLELLAKGERERAYAEILLFNEETKAIERRESQFFERMLERARGKA